ncbi:MAG: hypothetical protein KFH87_05625 [Bacteroidetes bacterium]|nr:hypothetical protein [Bacteroidota bacterium]
MRFLILFVLLLAVVQGSIPYGMAQQHSIGDGPHARQAARPPLHLPAADTVAAMADAEQSLHDDKQYTAMPRSPASRLNDALTHIVHGYHPYWISDEAAEHYRWDLLTHLAWFSYEVEPSTGEAITFRNWRTTTVIDQAKAAGVNVLLTVTNFGTANNRTLLSSPDAQDVLITRLLALLQERGAQGVNIDFEAVPGDQRENLVSFFAALRSALSTIIKDPVISVAAPAVDWNGAWDVAALSASVDLFFVMCYDYSWAGSSIAGPVAPIRGTTYNVERTLRWYLDEGVPPSKLLLGVPYYGYDWPVTGSAAGAATLGRATARTYAAVSAMLPQRTRQWSETFLNPWISYETSGWRQLWYDDEESLAYKYRLAKYLDLAGIGMWALGYDADLPGLWDLIEREFTASTSIARLPQSASFELWPHPLRAGVPTTISVRGIKEQGQLHASELILSDLFGRRVAKLSPLGNTDEVLRYRVPPVASGMYLFTIDSMPGRFLVLDK